MSILTELNTLFENLGLPVETGVFGDVAPDEYIVLTPLADTFPEHADNRPQFETQEVRISLFTKQNYLKRKNQIVRALTDSGIIITERLYVEHEDDTGYHHYAIDVAKLYELE